MSGAGRVEVVRADVLGEPFRRQVTDVLVRGFADDFAFFSRDPRVLGDAFEHMLILDRFHVALVDGGVAAVASVTEGAQECFAPRPGPFRAALGRLHGTVSYRIVRSQFLGAYDGARAGLAEIGFVTTAPEHQRRGVATALLRSILGLGYDELVLRDIKDTNDAALGLYRRLGFVESSRRPVRFARRAGFSAYVSLTWRQGT
ncbi:GNAT family N-acetyltransferase [Cellulosimicrobium marinum]|uniref:GNAT family N-acetyltransferase n=1 Tax=Cellulosimicrobium marinum TaxID=1638992 RepID=UPI001E3A7E8E|nr:GNAT family N-acetyltransferase [Cellulosimicrobium marinum]MCB7135936.1 GNAT family N-acetyltransferase [Cellulosimicrobium marinum]